ncbi:MAG: 5'-nucleotidase C-terminal domain-containing protein [Deltaproteobacteria bacterium]|nr:5'-nucleotidase C-terminal domain-containing protein [Deltaproteobacteria bacterium]
MPDSETVYIVATSDIHGFLAKDPARGRAGLAHLVGYLSRLRKKSPGRVFLVDSGDLFSGHELSNLENGRTAAGLLGRLGFRALTPGNHDFDFNVEEKDHLHYFRNLIPIMQAQSAERLTVTALNLDYLGRPFPGVENGPVLLGETPAGGRLTVVGVTSPYTLRPSLQSGLTGYGFGLKSSPSETTRHILAKLEEALRPFDGQGDEVVVLSHLGRPDAPDRISGLDLALTPNVSLVVDGHSHKICAPFRPSQKGGIYVNPGHCLEKVVLVAISRSAFNVELLGYAELTEAPEDERTASEIAALTAGLGLDEILTVVPKELFERDGAAPEKDRPLGRLICRALNFGGQADFVFLNPGAVRSGLSGEVTKAKALETLPFRDRLFSFPVQGDEIMAYFRLLVQKGLPTLPFLHGLTAEVVQSATPNFRLENLKTAAGEPIRLDQTYRAAATGQMLRIMNVYGPRPDLPDLQDCGVVAEIFMRGLKAMSPETMEEIFRREDLVIRRA